MGKKRGRSKKAVGEADTTITSKGDSAESANGNENKGRQAQADKKGPKSKNQNGRIVALRLSDKPGKLTREDLMCPICWSTLFEPTTLPCNHSLCETCFRKHVAETSLTCPCCRLRLSVWSRKVMKENNLLDEALWNRIKLEFPRLVEARLNGEDTQNIMDVIEDTTAHSSEESEPVVFDRTLCNEPGTIKEELQNMIKQHQQDLETERAREETASASLIKQIQEEEGILNNSFQASEQQDFLLAKKLQQEFEKEEKLQRLRSNPTQQQQKNKSHARNLMKDWSSTYSPDICELPKITQVKKSPRASLSSSTSKARNAKTSFSRRKSSATITSTDVSKASQDVMSKFLSLSQNQPPTPDSPSSGLPTDSRTPCCSKSLPVHDVRLSAFSPTKPSTNMRLIIPAESLAIPISSSFEHSAESFNVETNRTVDEPDTRPTLKTPDSINSEVDRHFRPIRGAPKTPPRRRPDGTFLPEPKLLRTTPIKPVTSASISAYICSPLKQIPNRSRPSCATMEKRISNDSGRASDDSRSPDVDGIGDSPTASIKGPDSSNLNQEQSYHDERGCTSDDYRVTPDDNSKAPDKLKRRNQREDTGSISSGSKKIKVETGTPDDKDMKLYVNQIKNEQHSPSLLDEQYDHVPLSFDISCTQGMITIDEDDEEYLDMENKAFDTYRQKAEQEAADRAFAEALQKDFNRGIRSPRGRNSKEKYSLRSWLNKPKINKQVKNGNRK